METNPILKFKQLPKKEVLEKLNNLATDAQWDFTNAKSPKGQRDAEERLNLYGSALEFLKPAVSDAFAGLFIETVKHEMKGGLEHGR